MPGDENPPGGTRTEHDALGAVEVPVDALWGAETQRAIENFPVSGQRIPAALIRALAQIKSAAARVNVEHGVLAADVGAAIAAVADEVAAGAYEDAFPVDVFQTGSGTSTNMNLNEVLARLASARVGRAVHPNDEVNASQSSNDVFPSAIRLAASDALVNRLVPALDTLASALGARATAFADVVKAGRTHLQDAAPVTLGAEFAGYAAAVRAGIERIETVLGRLGELPIGGTAVGTGLNAPHGFGAAVARRLAETTGLAVREARDHFEAQGTIDALVEASASCRTVAISCFKIANDLRWMASGPHAGLGEIRLPALQPGSSIMPGKVNPVVPEAVCQVVAQVVGNDAAVCFAAASGSFELNTMLPVAARNLLESIALLAAASRLLAQRCVVGIEADLERCRALAAASPSVATALNPHLGYEVATSVVQEALATGRDVAEVVVARGLMDAAEAARVLDVRAMASGGVVGAAGEPDRRGTPR